MKAVFLEGATEEVQSALAKLMGSSRAESIRVVTVDNEVTEEFDDRELITYDVAKSVLDRRPLNESHRIMLKALAEVHPQTLPTNDLMERLDLTSAQFRGFMGAFGKRISHTEGGENKWFFDQHWDHDLECVQYRLTEGALQAAKDLGLV